MVASVILTEADTRSHEAAHAVAAHLLGYEVEAITWDSWGDRGKLGSVRARWVGPIDDTEELAIRRAVVACMGPFVEDSWELDSSRGDRA